MRRLLPLRALPLGLCALALALALSAVGAGHALPRRHSVTAPTAFSVSRARATLVSQLNFGPRPAGSSAQRRAAEVLVRRLPGGHFEAVPGGLRNIVGTIAGRLPAIVVGAHYDTTPVAGYLGANNSAAGVGAVIELARDLAADRASATRRAVRFVLFDGEEAPRGFTDFLTQGLRGSRAYVAAHPHATREMVLLDFIALRGERLLRELGSDPALWARLRRAAARSQTAGYFPAGTAPTVLDDHTPFAAAGVPAVDLIDFNYRCWQRTCDDLAQVSTRSLAAVGATVLSLLRAERTR